MNGFHHRPQTQRHTAAQPGGNLRGQIQRSLGVVRWLAFFLLASLWVSGSWMASADAIRDSGQAFASDRAGKPGKPIARLPFELAGNHIFVQVKVEGAGPFSFVLDTGSSGSCVSEDLARALRLKRWPWTWRGEAIGGWTRLGFLRGVRLEVGATRRFYASLSTLNLPSLAQRPLDGILGGDWFRRYVVALDFEAGELCLFDPKDYVPAADLVSVPLRLRRRLPYVQASVGAGGQTNLPGQFLIDSGCGGWLVLASGFTRDHGLLGQSGPLQSEPGQDVVGPVGRTRGRVPAFQLGPYLWPRPVTHFETHPTLHPPEQVGVIGSGLLAGFRTVFDYRHRRLLLSPAAGFGTSPEPAWKGSLALVEEGGFRLKLCGADLLAAGPNFDRFEVARVLPGSPAALARLRVGDVVLALDGATLGSLTPAQWVEKARGQGGAALLEIQRGDRRLTRSLTLDWSCYSARP